MKKDGAAIKHQASLKNSKAQMAGFVQQKSDLRDKIKSAEWIRSLKEHPGFQLLEARWQKKYSYDVVMNAYNNRREKPDEFDKAIVGRAVVEDSYVFMKLVEEQARQAQVQLDMQEKEK